MGKECKIGRHREDYTYTIYDARGIPLGIVCNKCEAEVKSQFRPDVLTDSNYWSDEPIEADEPEEWF